MTLNDKKCGALRIIGVTGPIGAGKSYVTRLFKKEGFKTVSADRIYHLLTNKKSPFTDSLAIEFGDGILNTDGSLNRPALASIVFDDNEKLTRLNELTHKAVIDVILRKCHTNLERGECTTVVEVPLMFESGFNEHCSDVISVVASEETRLKRIMKRDALSEEQAKKRIKSQKNNNFYIEKSDKVVYNETYAGARKDFERILAELFSK